MAEDARDDAEHLAMLDLQGRERVPQGVEWSAGQTGSLEDSKIAATVAARAGRGPEALRLFGS